MKHLHSKELLSRMTLFSVEQILTVSGSIFLPVRLKDLNVTIVAGGGGSGWGYWYHGNAFFGGGGGSGGTVTNGGNGGAGSVWGGGTPGTGHIINGLEYGKGGVGIYENVGDAGGTSGMLWIRYTYYDFK